MTSTEEPQARDTPEPGPAPEAGRASSPEAEVALEIKGLIDGSADMVRDFLALVAVEGRLAGRSLAAMLLLAVVLGVVLVSVWMLLAGAAAFWLVERGLLSVSMSLTVVAVANLLLALLLWLAIVRLSRNLSFQGFVAAINDLLPGRREAS